LGTLGVLAKLVALAVILFVSFVLTEAIVPFGSSVPALLGASPVPPPVGQLSGGLLEVASAAFVGALFTAPLALVMFGKAGTWIKYVAGKSAKYLSLAVVFAFALEIAGAGVAGVADAAPGLLLLAALAAVAVLLMALASPSTLLRAASEALDAAHASAGFTSERRSGVVALELQVSPTAHVRGKERPERVRMEAIRFQRLVQALVSMGGRVELRLSFREGRGRILVLARGAVGREELQKRLLGIVKAQLPEFSAKARDVPEGPPKAWHCVSLVGVPEAAEGEGEETRDELDELDGLREELKERYPESEDAPTGDDGKKDRPPEVDKGEDDQEAVSQAEGHGGQGADSEELEEFRDEVGEKYPSEAEAS
jgi:hypothetical protein